MTSDPHPLSGASIERRLRDLAAFTDTEGAMTRLTLSSAHKAAVEHLSAAFRAAGMDVAVDPTGSLVGRFGDAGAARTLLIGSHIDTVRNGGIYDGNLGVIVGLAVVESLHLDGVALPFAIELVAFGDEEGVRFPSTLTGSKALAGRCGEAWLDERDRAGVLRRDALALMGAPAFPVAACARDPARLVGYVEVHIEQGPVLESVGLPVGVVSSLSGASRGEISITGTAGHAGTLPMRLRRDALTAAAEIILGIEARARADTDLVATVGTATIDDGAPNVVPGRVTLSLDVRAPRDETRQVALRDIRRLVEKTAHARGVEATLALHHDAGSTHCDARLSEILRASVIRSGVDPLVLHSGAGHDAMSFDRVAPIAMLFVRCRGGVSHSPDEYASPDDVEISARVLRDFILSLARETPSAES